jgi:hypothetical protein
MTTVKLVSFARVRFAVLATAVIGSGAVGAGIAYAGAAAGPPAPQLGVTVDVVPVSGAAFVVVPGGASERLDAAESVPVGTVIDSSAGTVRVIGATTGVATQSGEYSRGEFRVLQPAAHGHAVQARLVGGDFAMCADASGARAKTGQVIRQLSTKAGYGPITTGRAIGAQAKRYGGRAAATSVSAAVWMTIDTCHTTLLKVKRGALTPIAARPIRISPHCPAATDSLAADAAEQRTPGGRRPAQAARVNSSVLQTLHAGTTGTFRTRGRYAAACVRG